MFEPGQISNPLLESLIIAYGNNDHTYVQNVFHQERTRGTAFRITCDDELEMIPMDGNTRFVVTRNLAIDLGSHGICAWKMLCVLEGFSIEEGEPVPSWMPIGPEESIILSEMLSSVGIELPPIDIE